MVESLFLRLLLLLYTCSLMPQTLTLNLYRTDQLETSLQYDCLDYYVLDNIVSYRQTNSWAHQLIAYCMRPTYENERTATRRRLESREFIDGRNFTFNMLENQNITGQQLLTWSATIELVERYEAYLMNKSTLDRSDVYYNCTSPWFGNLCEYAFGSWGEIELVDVVYYSFEYKTESEPADVTCYTLLECNRGFSIFCLDWREICDGKTDCLNGGPDEEHCWQLDTVDSNDRLEDFQCHNGMQTIPRTFFHNGFYNPDCLDRSDEPHKIGFWDKCYQDPAFRCEEHACHPARGEAPLACGDGQCVDDLFKCRNRRGYFTPIDFLPSSISGVCVKSITCLTKIKYEIGYTTCARYCLGKCASNIKANCPPLFQFPSEFIALGHVFFLYTNDSADEISQSIRPTYVCYDQKQCDMYPLVLNITMVHRGSSCFDWNKLNFHFDGKLTWLNLVANVEYFFAAECSKTVTSDCVDSKRYRCAHSSRCISKRRLVDGVQDCISNDDETFENTCSLNQTFRFRCSDEEDKCVSSVVIEDGTPDCAFSEDESAFAFINQLSTVEISFPMICDSFQELKSIEINGRNETDETECHVWPCDTIYTRCNGIWNCPDGMDERNCSRYNCHSIDQLCVLWSDYRRTCLRVDNNHYWRNNLSLIDRSQLCVNTSLVKNRFECWTDGLSISVPLLCESLDGWSNDKTKWPTSLTHRLFTCTSSYIGEIRKLECHLSNYFKARSYGIVAVETSLSVGAMGGHVRLSFQSKEKREIDVADEGAWICHRGLSIFVKYDEEELQCLCPPSYYGDRCQYQSQRVSLTLKVTVDADWQTVFNFVLLLIDNQSVIESHDQVFYIPMIDCTIFKFNNYLLYRSRPKKATQNYSVQLHAYNKHTLEYRGSWLFPLAFAFLPVHRLAVEISISTDRPARCSLTCSNHGQCFKYVNREDTKMYYCRCDPGWSGVQCTIKHDTCHLCAADSLCVDRNLCVCPVGKDGPRCYLTPTVCKSSLNKCHNGGSCIPSDIRRGGSVFSCACPSGFSGARCQDVNKKIIFSFHSDLRIPESLRVHLIVDHELKRDQEISMFKNIPYDQTSVTVYISSSFHSIFVALSSIDYYLTYSWYADKSLIWQDTNTSISMTVLPLRRCPHISELLNSTLFSLHLLRRLKYYHLPCQQQLSLACFHDETHLCSCIDNHGHREANCYKTNHHTPILCQGKSNGGCLNEAQCIQDRLTCPISSTCICSKCFYGTRCQFTTQGFDLTLDAILGYQIQPFVSWLRQPSAVLASASFATIILIIGVTGSFLSILTFRQKAILDVGCGNYLLANAIISMLVVLLLTLKFWLLVLAQMTIIVQRSFLLLNCRSMDLLLRISLSTYDWLTACVAIERTCVTWRGVSFNKGKSRRIAKWIILIVVLIVTSTHLHDPFHRQLLDIVEEQRTWCIVTYGIFYRTFNSIILIVHFLAPFLINLISTVAIIVIAARQRSVARKEKSYRQHILEQLSQHKHVLISSCALVLLAVPRLIISLLSGCINSARVPWLLLVGYFISFLPPILTFVVFVLPSKTYKQEFRAAIVQLRRRFRQQCRFC